MTDLFYLNASAELLEEPPALSVYRVNGFTCVKFKLFFIVQDKACVPYLAQKVARLIYPSDLRAPDNEKTHFSDASG